MGKIDQGVIVLWMAKHFWKGNLGYIGYGGLGQQARDVLHVRDLFRLVQWQIFNLALLKGQIFNVGGGLENTVSLAELTDLCSQITGNNITISPALNTSRSAGTSVGNFSSNVNIKSYNPTYASYGIYLFLNCANIVDINNISVVGVGNGITAPTGWTDKGIGGWVPALQEVYRDGKLVKEITFDEVRANARK
jgi:hypothetical protein